MAKPADATVNRRLAIVSSFYTYVLRQGLVRALHPLQRLERRLVQPYPQARALDLAELAARLAAIPQETPEGHRAEPCQRRCKGERPCTLYMRGADIRTEHYNEQTQISGIRVDATTSMPYWMIPLLEQHTPLSEREEALLYICPVCGYPDLDDPPRSPSGGGSYERVSRDTCKKVPQG